MSVRRRRLLDWKRNGPYDFRDAKTLTPAATVTLTAATS